MNRDILKRAMELNGEGLRLAQIARQLGVSPVELRKEIAGYNDFEEAVVIVPEARKSLGKMAYDDMYAVFDAIRNRINDPFVSISDLSSIASTYYRIYKEENTGEVDNNDPITQLFGEEILNLKS
jgi:hypothetical protein